MIIRKKNKYYIILASLIVGVLFCIFYSFVPFIYETNDDMFIQRLVSGVETGSPESHLLFINYFIGNLLSILYKANSYIPWYGLLLCFSHFSCMTFILYSAITKTKEKRNKIILILSISIVYLIVWLPQVAHMQFTVTSAILAGCAIYYFLISESETNKEYIKLVLITSIFVAFSFCLRWEVTLMSLPFAFLVWLYKWSGEKFKFNKIIKIRYLLFPIIIGILLLGLYEIDRISYQSSEWKEFKDYSKTRAAIFDYYLAPEYESIEQLCQEYGVSKESYDALKDCNVLALDRNISYSFLKDLEIASKDLQTEKIVFQEKLSVVLNDYTHRLFMKQDRLYVFLIGIVYILLVLFNLFDKNRKIYKILMPFFMVFIRSIIWVCLLYKGRFPERISVSLYFIEMFILASLLVKEKIINKILLILRGKYYLLLSIYIILIVYLGSPQIRFLNYIVEEKLVVSDNYEVLTKYIKNNPQNFYFAEVQILNGGKITEKVLSPDNQELINYAFLGGWLPNSPWYQDKFDQYKILDAESNMLDENVYFVFRNDDLTSFNYFCNYIKSENPSAVLSTVEILNSGERTEYKIVQVKVCQDKGIE